HQRDAQEPGADHQHGLAVALELLGRAAAGRSGLALLAAQAPGGRLPAIRAIVPQRGQFGSTFRTTHVWFLRWRGSVSSPARNRGVTQEGKASAKRCQSTERAL